MNVGIYTITNIVIQVLLCIDYRENISSWSSSNSEVKASESLEDHEEIFLYVLVAVSGSWTDNFRCLC